MAFPFYGADGTSGTVAATNGSKTVVGTGTNWLSNNAIPSAGGYCVKMPDDQIYGINTCTGEGALSLTENYNGSTVSGGAYYIIPTAASNAALLNQVSTLLNSSNFSQIAGLTPNSGDFPEYLSGTWTTRTPTQVLLNLLNSMSETSIASASTCDIGASTTPKVQITGTTTITGFGSQTNAVRYVRFGGALTLTHNATNLILIGGASRTTAAGDVGIYLSDSSGHWREWAYFKADGTAISSSTQNYRMVDYVATSNITLASGLEDGDTLDSGTLVAGQKVLLTAQSTASQNGIYTVPSSGTASRASDANTEALLPSGLLVSVTRGTVGAGSLWRHTTAPGFTLGSTSLTFAKFGMLDSSSGAGGQLKFPATQNPSSDANTLDDYEEGTFTPGITIGGATTGITYSNQVGRYTKIGNRVWIDLTIVLSSKGSATGAILVTGLPFTSSAVTAYHASFTMGAFSWAAGNFIFGDIGSSATTMSLQTFSAGTTTSVTNASIGNSSQFDISGSYEVS